MDKLYTLIQKTPMATKAAIVAIFLGLLTGGHWYLIYQGQKEAKQKLEKKLVVLEKELFEKQEIAGNLSKFKKKVEYLRQKLEEKKKNLPDDSNMDQLLKVLNELSEKSDIRIVKFTPRGEVKKQIYAEIPVEMIIEGNYHEILTFFDKVAKEERIINISNITMEKPEIRSGKVVLSAKCLAKTFRALPPKKKGAKGAKKKRKKKKKKKDKSD
ncbi:MAG: type 4a pilus biogenesis protein PilO [Deltaproteobacteria bacterium]|nr:type 4a pilus biogenesis protein PilO [Deltaproteobacteria bacterium]